ncbi:MAG: glycosyltransferase family 39 protein [Actinobacteria bacterium]|nr:glycosyltransferase family 39 protein [Actinomycetota bacterium]
MSGAARDATPGVDRWVSLAAVVAAVSVLWLPYLRSSYWLDESGTAWVVNSGLGEAIRRSKFEGQSPAYYVVAWVARKIFGHGEVALRIPSLIAALITLWIVYRLGVALFDRRAGLIAAVSLAVLAPFAFAAVDARPYAIAVLFLAASTLSLVRWEQRRALRHGVGYALFSAAMLYFSYFFSLAFIAHAAYAYAKDREKSGVSLRDYAVSVGGIVVLAAPSAVHLRALLGQGDILAWVQQPGIVAKLLSSLLPIPLVAGLVASVALTAARKDLHRIRDGEPTSRLLAFTLAIIPPELLFVLSIVIAPKFFQPRYYVSFAVGMAVLAGWLIAGLSNRAGRTAAVAFMVVVAAFTYDGGYRATQDWRAASRVVNAHADRDELILFSPGLSSRKIDDPARAGLLRAPFEAYPVEGRIMLLPFDLVGKNGFRVYNLVTRDLAHTDRFLLVTGFETGPFRANIIGYAERAGFVSRTLYRQKFLHVTEFDRP